MQTAICTAQLIVLAIRMQLRPKGDKVEMAANVLIIGGSSGMGKAAAVACALSGFKVSIASRSADKLATAAKYIADMAKISADDVSQVILDMENENAADYFCKLDPGAFKHIVVTIGAGTGTNSLMGKEGLLGLRWVPKPALIPAAYAIPRRDANRLIAFLLTGPFAHAGNSLTPSSLPRWLQ